MGVIMKKLYLVLFLLFSGAYAWSADTSDTDSDASISLEELGPTLYQDHPREAVPFNITYAPSLDGTPPFACDGGTILIKNQFYNGVFLAEEVIRHSALGVSMHPDAMKAVSEQLWLFIPDQTKSEGER